MIAIVMIYLDKGDPMEEKTKKTLEQMPEFLTGQNLVDLGLYRSQNMLYHAKKRGQAPDYIQFEHKILYPKASVLRFIEERTKPGNIDKTTEGRSE